MKNDQIDWLKLMKISFQKFGILPHDFWNMTIKELHSLHDFEELNILNKQKINELKNLIINGK